MTRPTRLGSIGPLMTIGTVLHSGDYESGQVPTSTGSNGGVAWGSNVAIISANSSNYLRGPFVNIAAGSNILLTLDAGPGGSVPSNTVRIHAQLSGGSTSITANSSNTISPVNLISGSDILFAATGSSLTISSGANKTATINAVLASASSNSAMTAGWKGDLVVDFPCTIEQWTLVADQTGSLVVDVKKDPYSGFPPTTSITGSAKPTIVSATKAQSGVLTGWTTSIAAGDVLRYNVDSCSAITQATLALRVRRT